VSSNNLQEAGSVSTISNAGAEAQVEANSPEAKAMQARAGVEKSIPMPEQSPTKSVVKPAKAKSKRKWMDTESDIYEKDLDYMSSAAAAVLQQSPRGGQQLLWAIATFFVACVTWASMAYVDEFTRGEGKVIPSTKIKKIANLEGGIVAELYVTEGQVVKAGQKLLRIDDTQFSSELRGTDVTVEQLRAKMSRLTAEADGVALAEQPITGISELVWGREMSLFISRRQEQDGRNRILIQQETQKRQELNELKAKLGQHSRSYKLQKQELDLTRPLVKSGAVSQVELLRLERDVNNSRGDMRGAELAIPRARSALQEAKDKSSSSRLTFQSEARRDLNEVRLEMQRLAENSDAIKDKVKRTVVTSPVAGTIKTVNVNTIGGIIQPGMEIIEIVPIEDSLLVEAKIKPSDIAYLHPGQNAIVKVTAYDFAIHGGLGGEVVHISPDTITDEEGNSFYLVSVKTEKSFLGTEAKPLPIISGMTVSVDVLTGEKTVLDYVLKPILKTKQLALRER